MTKRKAKVTSDGWIDAARSALIEDGLAGVKVDRLAKKLGVTRGGFFHNFRDRKELLARLLDAWEARCQFLPPEPVGDTPGEAVAWVDRLIERLLSENDYDSAFDMAVREWARSDSRTAWAVERSDRLRIAGLNVLFQSLGYPTEEAEIRARVFYFHQIGYYAIGMRVSGPQRRRQASIYLDILCGKDVIERARACREVRARAPG